MRSKEEITSILEESDKQTANYHLTNAIKPLLIKQLKVKEARLEKLEISVHAEKVRGWVTVDVKDLTPEEIIDIEFVEAGSVFISKQKLMFSFVLENLLYIANFYYDTHDPLTKLNREIKRQGIVLPKVMSGY